MIAGYFEGVEEGSSVKRLALGFGSGATELTTAVEGYQMTKEGPRLLGTGELQYEGGKTPGIILPLGVLAATGNPIGLVVMGGPKWRWKRREGPRLKVRRNKQPMPSPSSFAYDFKNKVGLSNGTPL